MTPGKPRNIGASVRARLLNLSRQTGEDYQFMLQRYAAERFLYRLGESEHRDNFVLKGAMLLALWRGGMYRPTRDLDFTAYGNYSWGGHLRSTLQEICSIPAEDGIVFDNEEIRLESIREHAAYNSFRAKLKASIGKTRISLQIDIGFGNAIQPSPVDSEYTTLLDHPPPRIRVYPREAFVAEKLHAMVFHGERNTRYKDFYDLCTLANHFVFDGKSLIDGIVATFELRRTTISKAQPVALTPQFYADVDRAQQWRNYLERGNLLGAPSDFDVVGELLSIFLTVVWRAIANKSDFTGKWSPGGPWRKNSGIEWLGEIPLHWEVKQLKRLFDVRNGSTPRSAEPSYWDGDLTWVTPEDIGRSNKSVIQSSKRCITEAGLRSCGTSLIPAKSLVLSTRAPIGHVAIAGVDLCTNQGCRGLVPRVNLSEGYYYYFLLAARSELQSLGQGSTYRELSKDLLSSMNVLAPDFPDQIAIVRFLDREMTKIDALVAKQQQQIELLREKRAALITQAVTNGFAPDVPTKDSGVDWFGEIPSHWSAKRLKTFARIRYGLGQPPQELSGGLPLIRATNIVRGHITAKAMVYIDSADVPKDRDAFLAAKEIIVVRSGAYTADSAIIPSAYDGAVAGYDMVVTVHGAAPEFVAFSLLSSYVRDAQLIVLSTRSAQPHLNAEELGAAVVFLPPLAEQQAIVEFLEQETAKIDAIVAKVREAIERLRELRVALISAAVTGKIDVRDELSFVDPAGLEFTKE